MSTIKKARKNINASILIIGNEILSGRTQDANVSFISNWLNLNCGISVKEVRIIPDIEKKIIRHVSDAFVEDPLRVFRVARFFARFEDFEIHEDTEDLMKKIVNNGEIKFLSIERIKNELLKGLEEKYVDKMFLSFNQCGVLKEILPDFSEENKKLNSFLFSLLIELRNTPNTFSAESKLLMVLLLLVINNVDKSNYFNDLNYFLNDLGQQTLLFGQSGNDNIQKQNLII